MRRSLILAALIGFLIAGCSKPETAFVGKWKLDVASISTGDAGVDAKIKQNAANIILEFKGDKTCSLALSGAGQEATYEVAGKVATIRQSNPKSEADLQPSTCTVSDDGKSLTLQIPGAGNPLKFLRQAT